MKDKFCNDLYAMLVKILYNWQNSGRGEVRPDGLLLRLPMVGGSYRSTLYRARCNVLGSDRVWTAWAPWDAPTDQPTQQTILSVGRIVGLAPLQSRQFSRGNRLILTSWKCICSIFGLIESDLYFSNMSVIYKYTQSCKHRCAEHNQPLASYN